ncbi:hypothetical protein KL906_004719 [Ogataea polymorpha]|nr:hypothetical protein KL908_004132 [Ogataea polymorpha]KAG7906266.1 hypothetical protein KL906_004719 [Ogataea polymorpha]KAG7930649.1 hypothetical protein KL934_004722 [Ogataea polymorpha]
MSASDSTYLALRDSCVRGELPDGLGSIASLLTPVKTLQILLVDLPETASLRLCFEAAQSALKGSDATESLPLPDAFALPEAVVAKLVAEADSLLEEEVCRWHFDSNGDLYFQFVQARIFKTNYYLGVLPAPEEIEDLVVASEFTSKQLTDWWSLFYVPLANLAKYGDLPLLLDFVDTYSPTEQTELFIGLLDTSNHDRIVHWLCKYHTYLNDNGSTINDYILSLGNAIVTKSSDQIEAKFETLTALVKSSDLLAYLQASGALQKFVSIVLAIIYLCPEVSLSLYMKMKEILVCLKLVDAEFLAPNTDQTLTRKATLQEMANSIAPCPEIINILTQYVETGERLFSNNMSLAQVAELPNLDSQDQYNQLERFILTESEYLTTTKQWESLLSSIYFLLNNTHVFNKVKLAQVDELVLSKLLSKNMFVLTTSVFLPKYCTLETGQIDKIIINAAWDFYRKATNCDPSMGYLKSARNCLQMASSGTLQLDQLITANQELLHWKLYFKPGVPIKPLDILEAKDPLKIVSRILELNDRAYKETELLESLLLHLSTGLDSHSQDEMATVKLRLLCLDFAIAQDFGHSLQLALTLIDMAVDAKQKDPKLFGLIQERWFSIFQLVKNDYVEPQEHEQITQKLHLLQRLMLIVPTEFNTNVLEQWQLLNSILDQVVSETPPSGQTKIEKSNDLGKNIIGWIVGAQ